MGVVDKLNNIACWPLRQALLCALWLVVVAERAVRFVRFASVNLAARVYRAMGNDKQSIGYPIEFNGGPYDGIMCILAEQYSEVLQPRCTVDDMPSPDEIDFNMSMLGKPYNDTINYERYVCSGRIITKRVHIPDGEYIDGVAVMVYNYYGVVEGPCDDAKYD